MKHICQECGRPATYQRKQVGRKRADRRRANKQHDMCQRCFEKAMMSKWAQEMKEAA